MNIGIITFHRAENYGAVLQAYALQEFISDNFKNCDVKIIDYRSVPIESAYSYRKLILSGNPIKIIAKILLRGPRVYQTKRNFKEFVNKRLVISETFNSENIETAKNEFDCIVAGSDQIFNLAMTNHDMGYFLQGEKHSRNNNSCSVISYAASTGTIPSDESYQSELLNLLKLFDALSFREKSSYDWCTRHGLRCQVNADPVMLLDEEKWSKLAKKSRVKPYVLYFCVQSIENEMKTLEFAKKKASELECELCFLSIYGSIHDREIQRLQSTKPEEFLGLIKNAECVVTDSFHASVFSIIFHKNFFVETNIKNNARILDLLDLTGLSCLSMKNGIVMNPEKKIDWKSIDTILEEKRKETYDYFREYIQ